MKVLYIIVVGACCFSIGYDMGKKAREQEIIEALKDHRNTLIEYKHYIKTHPKNK